MQSGPFVLGRNADADALAIKHAHVRARHVAPLNSVADKIAEDEGLAPGLVPYVDPQLGGTHARILALLDNPSTKAEAGSGSGLLSLENDDNTAKNCARLYNELGLGPELFVHWNVAPAPISGAKNSGSSAAERERGARWLKEIVALLPHLEVVLLMGNMARDGWQRAGLHHEHLVIPSAVPHPSQRGLNQDGGRTRLRQALVTARNVVEGRREMRRPISGLQEHAVSLSTKKWAWWPTFEHYCAPQSSPWGTSSNLQVIERAIDRHQGPPLKWCVIAKATRTGWTLVYRRKDRYTYALKSYQIDKYNAARAGGQRGNLGPVPPSKELRVQTQDLDM